MRHGRVLFLLLIFLILCSCNQPEKEDIKNDSNYKIAKESYISGETRIYFPQVSSSNNSKQKQINELIKSEALKVMKYYDEAEEYFVEIDYEIQSKDEKLLSISYSGMGAVKGAAHPNNLFYTTNINMIEAMKVRLVDLITIDESFIDRLLKEEFEVLEPDKWVKTDIVDLLSDSSVEDLIRKFKFADSLDHIGTVNHSDIFSFVTNDSLGISISTSHAVGDHVELMMKFK